MINRIKVGKYLKSLRLNKKRDNDGKSFSQDDLSSEFYRRGVSISVNSIAEWENGSNLPSPNNLKILTEIFGKTIEEILDGEGSKDVDYSKIYFISNENWMENFDHNVDLYQLRNEQIKLIIKRFKELILIRISRAFTISEESEFRFLFNNFYSASDYISKYSNIKINDEYIKFKDALNEAILKIRNMTPNGKYWELQKLYSEKRILWFTHWTDVHDLKKNSILQERFNEIEDWQKDMLLAMFQNIEPFDANIEQYGSAYLNRYEKNNGEYSHDFVIKNEIRELIKRGACLNKYFLNIKESYYETRRIIDRLEELYNLCLKPIEIHLNNEDGSIDSYLIENNLKNRFLVNYYCRLKIELKGHTDNYYSDAEEIYKWFTNNDEVPEENYLEIAKKNNIDTNQDKKYWLSDVKRINNIDKTLKEFKNNEKNIAKGLIEIDVLKNKLNAGEKEYKLHMFKIIGGNDEASIRNNIEHWKQRFDYSEYLKSRDKELTQKLLEDLDILSLQKIKEKYFKMEVIENE